jgi:hypothetical protein
MMKKKTVITTETREVWVIHRPSDETHEREEKHREVERDADSLSPFRYRKPDKNEADGHGK